MRSQDIDGLNILLMWENGHLYCYLAKSIYLKEDILNIS